MTNSATTPSAVPPVQRAIKLLRHIGAGNSCSNISLTAKATGINRTTLQRLLDALCAEGMVEQLPAGAGYQLGIGLATLSSNAIFSRDIVQVSQPILRGLAANLGLSAHLGIHDGQSIVYLVRETPNLHLVSNVSVGSKLPVHATTIGRIILANLMSDELDIVIKGCAFVAATAMTPTSPNALREQLVEDRKSGVAWSVGNFEPGIGSCAVAVFDHTSRVVGAINVTGPDHHFLADGGRRAEIFAELQSAGRAISTQLGHVPEIAAGNALDGRLS